MFNPGNNGEKNNSFLELVDNDFLMNFIAEQQPIPASIPRTTSNPQFFNQNFQQFSLNSFNSNQFNSFQNQDRPMHFENNIQGNWNGFDQSHFPYQQFQMPFPEQFKEDFPRQNLSLQSQVFGFVKDENPQQDNMKQKPRQKKKALSPMKTPSQVLQKRMIQDFQNKIVISSLIRTIQKIPTSKKSPPQLIKIMQVQKSKIKRNINIRQNLYLNLQNQKEHLILSQRIINYLHKINLKMQSQINKEQRMCKKFSKTKKNLYRVIRKQSEKFKYGIGKSQERNQIKHKLPQQNVSKLICRILESKLISSYLDFFLGKNAMQSSDEPDQNEINLLLDSMRLRIGGGGKERVTASNFFFNELLDLSIYSGVQHKVIRQINKILIDKDIFYEKNQDLQDEQSIEINNWAEWSKEFGEKINLTNNQKFSLLKFKSRLNLEKIKIEENIKKLVEIKESLYNRTSQFENFVDELRNILNTMQFVRFLVGIEQQKSKKEIKILKILDENNKLFDEELEIKQEILKEEEQPQKKLHI